MNDAALLGNAVKTAVRLQTEVETLREENTAIRAAMEQGAPLRALPADLIDDPNAPAEAKAFFAVIRVGQRYQRGEDLEAAFRAEGLVLPAP
jgi:hypothetical protein